MATPFENLVDFLSKKSSVCGRILTLQNPFHFVRRNLAHLALLGATVSSHSKTYKWASKYRTMLFAYLLPLWFLPLILLLFYVLFDILFIVQKSNKISCNHLLISLLSKFFCPYIICVFTLYCTVVKKAASYNSRCDFFRQ